MNALFVVWVTTTANGCHRGSRCLVAMSSTATDLVPSYVLHTRLYRDTSLLVTIFTATHGKLTVIARGARKTTKSTKNPRYLLQPFIPLVLSWQGKSTLKTLTSMEAAAPQINFVGNRLYSAMYINELMMYLLKDEDINLELYHAYQQALHLLHSTDIPIEVTLRHFEFSLLSELGYAINFRQDADDGDPIDPEKDYYYVPEQGFVATTLHPDIRAMAFSGHFLQAISQNDYSHPSTRQAAKWIARIALSPHLQHRTLKSRELFVQYE